MNQVLTFLERQQGNYNGTNYDFALSRLAVHESDNWNGIEPSTESADYNPEPPIFTAKFANCDNYRHILAIANEDGKIALQNTDQTKGPAIAKRTLEGQQSHYNAVFDLEWMPGQMKFVSASGDHTACLWDVENGQFKLSRIFNGHTRSVKTAAFRNTDSSVFATGGRDGAILIWDIRAALTVSAIPRADNIIYRGHAGGPGTPHSSKRKTRQTPELAPNALSSSITGLVFQDDNTLVSCGAGDGIIKVWDLRRNYTSYKREPLPKHSIVYPGTSTFKGFTNLLIDKSRLKLYVNCMDNSIYCYNLNTYSSQPLMRFTGLRNSTFYIKSSLSGDGQYLLSGSSDERAYIWNVNNPQPLVALVGHSVEVTCVAWSHANDLRLVTCSDDTKHKIWRIGPEQIDSDEKMNYFGMAESCANYKHTLLKVRLKTLENTPRSIRRLIERNETTPSSTTTESSSNKRTFSDMIGDDLSYNNDAFGSEQKRPHLETRARRLFSPATSAIDNTEKSIENLGTIPEEIERSPTSPYGNRLMNSPNKQTTTKIILSPLTERHDRNTQSPECTNSSQQCPSTSIFSPTSNLPNYVLNGEAPHLTAPSPKRKLKENVDWLTKIRKQKLLSTISSSQKLNGQLNGHQQSYSDSSEMTDHLLSPRLQTLKSSSTFECGVGSSRTPRRRSSSSSVQNEPNPTGQQPKTPTSRRNSETTILRFFQRNPITSKPSTAATTGTPDQ